MYSVISSLCLNFFTSGYFSFRTFEALGAVIEPHQVVATLSCLTSVARPLVAGGEEFPAGQLHVLTLLRLALPGIDPNDFRKSMVSSLSCKIVPFQRKSKGVSFICHLI